MASRVVTLNNDMSQITWPRAGENSHGKFQELSLFDVKNFDP